MKAMTCSGRNFTGNGPWLEHTSPRGVGTLVSCRAHVCRDAARGEQN